MSLKVVKVNKARDDVGDTRARPRLCLSWCFLARFQLPFVTAMPASPFPWNNYAVSLLNYCFNDLHY
jgi:hypothetical protein